MPGGVPRELCPQAAAILGRVSILLPEFTLTEKQSGQPTPFMLVSVPPPVKRFGVSFYVTLSSLVFGKRSRGSFEQRNPKLSHRKNAGDFTLGITWHLHLLSLATPLFFCFEASSGARAKIQADSWPVLHCAALHVLPSGSSRITKRPFLHTTFPVAASINISEGMLETLYLFHSFSCKRDRRGTKKPGGVTKLLKQVL